MVITRTGLTAEKIIFDKLYVSETGTKIDLSLEIPTIQASRFRDQNTQLQFRLTTAGIAAADRGHPAHWIRSLSCTPTRLRSSNRPVLIGATTKPCCPSMCKQTFGLRKRVCDCSQGAGTTRRHLYDRGAFLEVINTQR